MYFIFIKYIYEYIIIIYIAAKTKVWHIYSFKKPQIDENHLCGVFYLCEIFFIIFYCQYIFASFTYRLLLAHLYFYSLFM